MKKTEKKESVRGGGGGGGGVGTHRIRSIYRTTNRPFGVARSAILALQNILSQRSVGSFLAQCRLVKTPRSGYEKKKGLSSKLFFEIMTLKKGTF